ncbi:hypothetical protein WJX79_007595 [Trebouxia sp. C0005]
MIPSQSQGWGQNCFKGIVCTQYTIKRYKVYIQHSTPKDMALRVITSPERTSCVPGDWLPSASVPPCLLNMFRSSRSTIDALFSLRILCNEAWDKGQTLHNCMLDPTKAFDSVDREMAWQIQLSKSPPSQSLLLSSETSTHITQ